MRYYFEILRPWHFRHLDRPAGIYSLDLAKSAAFGNMAIAQMSERIWSESAEDVSYIKDRVAWNRRVDMEEFTWIKLKAIKMEEI